MSTTAVFLALVAVFAIAGGEIEKRQTTVTNDELVASINSLTRQVMLQQLFIEERIRSSGHSGLKQIRYRRVGTRPYHFQTHGLHQCAAMHDHSNNDRTIGMGEFIAVMNGNEFRTRHNDFRLYMPSTTDTTYDAVEDVPLPDVPPAVGQKATVPDQVAEMKEWFKAFAEQDYSVRDYRPYFKPILCYLEGAWTNSGEAVDESFESDRHAIAAATWFELQEKIRYASYVGTKDALENFAYLPTKINKMIDDITPEFAQWNYRIVCHPLSEDLPTDRFKIEDDVAGRIYNRYSLHEHGLKRGARYQLNPDLDVNSHSEFVSQRYETMLIDKLMYEIPGKDGYDAVRTDSALGQTPYSLLYPGESVNTARYHRAFELADKDAMGEKIVFRGFSDANLYVAFTDQQKVSELTMKECPEATCNTSSARVSYAIPLEIIYLTPLYNWNPYNLKHWGKAGNPIGNTASKGRNGHLTDPLLAFDGTNSKTFYRTPIEFFSGSEVDNDPADTTKNGGAGVLDQNGEIHICAASGSRIFLPDFGMQNPIRLRYPIMPLHDEGTATRKELEALKDIVMDIKMNRYMRREVDASYQHSEPATFVSWTETQPSTKSNYPVHTHYIGLTANDVVNMIYLNKPVQKFTSVAADHQHDIELEYINNGYSIKTCDGRPWTCKYDGHKRRMVPFEPQDVPDY